jgi:hypothetical protein
MLMFFGELLSVETGEYNSLVFRSTRYDVGLKEYVPCSVSVGISDECKQYLANYRSNIGNKVAVGVDALITKKSKVFCLTQTDILDIDSLINH